MYLEIFPTPQMLADWKIRDVAVFAIESDGRDASVEVELADKADTFEQRLIPANKSGYYSTRTGWNGVTVPSLVLAKLPARIDALGRKKSFYGTQCVIPATVWATIKLWDKIFYRATAWRRGERDFRVPLKQNFSPERYMCAPYVQGQGLGSRDEYRRCYQPQEPANRDMKWLAVVENVVTTVDTAQAGTKNPPPVVLRGINVCMNHRRFFYGPPGATQLLPPKDQHWHTAAGITWDRLKTVADWGGNIVRITLNQEWALEGWDAAINRTPSPPVKKGSDYLADLDQVVNWASEHGLYVLLALHTASLRKENSGPGQARDDDGNDLKVVDMYLPDNGSLLFWTMLASRYVGNPAVLYDLCNEPHRKGGSDDKFLAYYPEEIAADDEQLFADRWHVWVARLVSVIRTVHPKSLIFVSGLAGACWSSSLGYMPVYDGSRPLDNIVYSFHWYRWPGLHNDTDWTSCWQVNSARSGPASKLKSVNEAFPVFAGEWGVNSRDSMRADVTQACVDNTTSEQRYHDSLEKMPSASEPDWAKWADDLVKFLGDHATTGPDGKWKGLAGFTAWSYLDTPAIFKMFREGCSKAEMGQWTALRDCDPSAKVERDAAKARVQAAAKAGGQSYAPLDCSTAPELTLNGSKVRDAIGQFRTLAAASQQRPVK